MRSASYAGDAVGSEAASCNTSHSTKMPYTNSSERKASPTTSSVSDRSGSAVLSRTERKIEASKCLADDSVLHASKLGYDESKSPSQCNCKDSGDHETTHDDNHESESAAACCVADAVRMSDISCEES